MQKMAYEIDVDRLIYALHLRRKVELARADIAAGCVVSHEEVEREMEEWRG